MSTKLQVYDEFNTVVNAYRHFAKTMKDKVVYTFQDYTQKNTVDEVSITYGELDRKARSLAAYLLERRAQGERVILLYTAGIEYIEAYFGCLYAGAIPVPAYPPSASRFFASRLHSMIPDSQAKFALTTSEIKKDIDSKHNEIITGYDLSWIITDTLEKDYSSDWYMPSIDGHSIAFLQYTSGSTSSPKGVIVTHNNLLHNISLIGGCFKPLLEEGNENISGVIWLPPYHDMGLIGGILALPHFAASVHLMSPFAFIQQPYRWLETISRYGSQISAAPNFTFDLCVKSITDEQKNTLDLSKWRIVYNGAEPVNPRTMDEFTKAFEVCGFRKETFYPCYGLAEASLIVSGGKMEAEPIVKAFNKNLLEENIVEACATDAGHARLIVGCGTELPDGRICIVNSNTFRECSSNEVGEIWIKGPSITKGYWNKSELTKETFNAYMENTGDGPFMRTGDLGFIYEEELFITGRLKDLIIIDGRNINPNDIEHTVEDIHPLFCKNSTAAFSIEVEGEESLVIVQEVNRRFNSEISKDVEGDVRNAIRELYDLPVHDVAFVKQFSIKKTSSGKIQRRACKEDYLKKTLQII